MKKLLSFIRNGHSEMYKILLFIISIAIIVYVFPKQGKFKYEFYNLKGKPWYHEDLIAPFDFSIKKTNEELANERAAILKNIKPYFKFDTSIVTAKRNEFISAFNINWNTQKNKNFKETNLAFATALIDSIYNNGIIAPAAIIEGKPDNYSIYILYKNVAEDYEIQHFYTVQTAYNYIQKSLIQNQHVIDLKYLSPLLENCIAHNVFYDKTTSDRVVKQAIDDISPSRDIIIKNQNIISKGEIIDDQKFQILESLKAEYEDQSGNSSSYLLILTGQILIVVLCLSILIVFLVFYRKDIFFNNTKITFILLLIILQVMMVSLASNAHSFNIYLLPFCILPIIIRAFYDTRIALFVHWVTILLISIIAPNRFEFMFIQLLGGMVAIFSILNMRNRSQIFISAVLIFLTYSIAYVSITIIQEGGKDLISWLDFAWFGVSAMLTLFSFPLIFVFEKIFGFTSDVTLLELSDTNRKLLRELASRAPGTFQHSLQVANIAEEAIYLIGGNALLVRTGALYHDIGKMEMPMYFIENQTTGINPHNETSFDESATIIINHVTKGIEIAKKHNLPEQIIDFIRTHHGTTITEYFYRSFKNTFPLEEIDESRFHYPGPIPFSKETAVLMMADSVEAASRSLKTYDAETIDQLVERILNFQIEQNQFVNTAITFKDINILKKIFKKKLMNIYHVRVEYPR